MFTYYPGFDHSPEQHGTLSRIWDEHDKLTPQQRADMETALDRLAETDTEDKLKSAGV